MGVSGQDFRDDLVLCLSDVLRLEVTSELGDSLEAIIKKIKRIKKIKENKRIKEYDSFEALSN